MVQFQELRCCECAQLLGVWLSDNGIFNNDGLFCYLCAHNLCDVADTLGLTNVPGTQDLYRALWDGKEDNFEHDAERKARAWRETIISWRNEQREIIAKEKVNQLLAKRRVG